MIYKVVPAAMVVVGTDSSVADYFQNIINKHAVDGWEFYSMETATAEESPGCALLGMAPKRTNMNLLVFRKAQPGDTTSAPVVVTEAPKPVTVTAPKPAPVVTHGMTAAPKPAAPSVPMWVCKQCGTSNKPEHGLCKKCGAYRSSR